MSTPYPKKIEIVANYLVMQFIKFTVDDKANVNGDLMQELYKDFDKIPKKVIRERKFEPKIVNESVPLAKQCILRDFAEYLI